MQEALRHGPLTSVSSDILKVEHTSDEHALFVPAGRREKWSASYSSGMF